MVSAGHGVALLQTALSSPGPALVYVIEGSYCDRSRADHQDVFGQQLPDVCAELVFGHHVPTTIVLIDPKFGEDALPHPCVVSMHNLRVERRGELSEAAGAPLRVITVAADAAWSADRGGRLFAEHHFDLALAADAGVDHGVLTLWMNYSGRFLGCWPHQNAADIGSLRLVARPDVLPFCLVGSQLIIAPWGVERVPNINMLPDEHLSKRAFWYCVEKTNSFTRPLNALIFLDEFGEGILEHFDDIVASAIRNVPRSDQHLTSQQMCLLQRTLQRWVASEVAAVAAEDAAEANIHHTEAIRHHPGALQRVALRPRHAQQRERSRSREMERLRATRNSIAAGAAIGGLVAGPFGAVVGGAVGWTLTTP